MMEAGARLSAFERHRLERLLRLSGKTGLRQPGNEDLVGKHELQNGLFLRSDLHTLLDQGYLTITPDLNVRVSTRIRKEFENGREYYALDKRPIQLPKPPFPPPAKEMLEWHADAVFRG
jgi:predicted restriction endonuclease